MQKFQDIITRNTGSGLQPVRSASIQVNTHGGSAATIYSNNSGTAAANPLTADSSGYFSFYAADGRYDLEISGANIATYTLSDIQLFDSTASTSAASISTIQSGTGAVSRSVQAKLREIEVNLADFGTVGNAAGDDAVWTLALNYLSTQPAGTGLQGVLVLPRGQTYLASPRHLGPNVTIRGMGLRFATQIVPASTFSGAALFIIDGADVTGGWNFYVNFEDLLIDQSGFATATIPIAFKYLSAYSCTQKDVYVYNGCGKIATVQTCNDIKFVRPRYFGQSVTLCTHGIHAISNCSLTVSDADMEVMGAGIQQDADSQVTVLGGYAERNTRGWYNNGSSSGMMTVVGGYWQGVNSGTIAAEVKGGNCTVMGGRYVANGGAGLFIDGTIGKPANTHFIGPSGDIGDARNFATTKLKTDVTNCHKTVLPNRKQVSDNVATTVYTLTGAYDSGNGGYVDLKIFAQLHGVPYSLAVSTWRIAFAAIDGSNFQVTAVTEIGKTTVNGSGNYGLTVAVAASAAALVLSLQVTANSSGALGDGTAIDLVMEAELWQQSDTGAAYIAAN